MPSSKTVEKRLYSLVEIAAPVKHNKRLFVVTVRYLELVRFRSIDYHVGSESLLCVHCENSRRVKNIVYFLKEVGDVCMSSSRRRRRAGRVQRA